MHSFLSLSLFNGKKVGTANASPSTRLIPGRINRLSTNRHGHIHPVRTLSGVSAHRVYRQDIATANASLSTDHSIFFSYFFFDCTTANQDAQVSHPSLQR